MDDTERFVRDLTIVLYTIGFWWAGSAMYDRLSRDTTSYVPVELECPSQARQV